MSEDRFDEALRRWADRPSETDPSAAARQVLDRLEESTPYRQRSWWVAGAVGAALAAAALVLVLGAWPPEASRDPGAAPGAGRPADAVVADTFAPDRVAPDRVDTPTLDDDVVLIWLDQETPLYLNVPETRSSRGDTT